MDYSPTLNITSPNDGVISNKTSINISISLTYFSHDGHVHDFSKYKNIKLFVDGNVAAVYEFTGNINPSLYTFTNVDLSGYANRGFPVTVQARAYYHKYDNYQYVESGIVNILVDTTASVFSNIQPLNLSTLTVSAPDISARVSDTGGSHLKLDTLTVILDDNPVAIPLQNITSGAGQLPTDAITFLYNPGSLSDGYHTVVIKIEDQAGNKSESGKLTFTIDTTPPVIESVFPDGIVVKEQVTDLVKIKAMDKYSGINLSLCSAYLKSNYNKIINLDIKESGVIPADTSFEIHFGAEGEVSNLGVGTHELHLKLTDTVGNAVEKTYPFELKYAIPFNDGKYQVCRSFTDGSNNPAAEPYILPPVFDYGNNINISIPDCVAAAETWEFADNGLMVKTEKYSQLLEVVIPGDGCWSADAQARKNLLNSFKNILAAIESRETDLFNGGASYLVQSLIPRLIPMSGSEILSWYCGMDRSQRSIQLLPGFRIRINTGAFQYCGPGKDEINGMVPQGDIILPVIRKRAADGTFITCLDPLLYELAPKAYSQGDDALLGRIGGLFDLFTGGMSRKHMAVIMPATIPSVFTDSAARNEHVILASADTRAILDSGIKAATDVNVSSNGAVLRWFQGRTSLTVELPVVINGKRRFVPVGTTLHQICDKELFGFTPSMMKTGQISWQRQWTDGVLAGAAGGDLITLKDVQWIDLGQAPVTGGMDIGDTPLLPGDRIDIRVTK